MPFINIDMKEKFVVSAAPHLQARLTTPFIMLEVIFALTPAIFASIYFFGWQAVKVILATVSAAIFTEIVFQRMRKKPVTIKDNSALLTGILLALCLPAGLPVWLCFIGGAAAIILGKQIYGGLGYNVFNPALIGRAVLTISWPALLSTWPMPRPGWGMTVEGTTGATPLAIAKGIEIIKQAVPDYASLFWGNISGSMGETSSFCLLFGGLYLLIRKRISWHIPFCYLGTVALLSSFFKEFGSASFNLLSGGLMLGALFMATDYVTSPITPQGKIIFGIGCGLITCLIRFWGRLPEGVCFAILFMNALTPLIERCTRPRLLGGKKYA